MTETDWRVECNDTTDVVETRVVGGWSGVVENRRAGRTRQRLEYAEEKRMVVAKRRRKPLIQIGNFEISHGRRNSLSSWERRREENARRRLLTRENSFRPAVDTVACVIILFATLRVIALHLREPRLTVRDVKVGKAVSRTRAFYGESLSSVRESWNDGEMWK